MPKHLTAPRQTQTQRPAPYHVRTSSANMATTMAPMSSWTQLPQSHNMRWHDPRMHYSQASILSDPYMVPLQTPSILTAHSQEDLQPKPGQSAPWTPEEDNVLLNAKTRGLAWEEIHTRHFPGKSGNACRKRHERLLHRARKSDWDDSLIQRCTEVYIRKSPSFWKEVAQEIGGVRGEDAERMVRHLWA
jgi:hypothetical protein